MSFSVSKIWKEWLTEDPEVAALFETIPTFFPLELIEQDLIWPINPLESSNRRDWLNCLTYEPIEKTRMYED